jgi:hypothetical protein
MTPAAIWALTWIAMFFVVCVVLMIAGAVAVFRLMMYTLKRIETRKEDS